MAVSACPTVGHWYSSHASQLNAIYCMPSHDAPHCMAGITQVGFSRGCHYLAWLCDCCCLTRWQVASCCLSNLLPVRQFDRERKRPRLWSALWEREVTERVARHCPPKKKALKRVWAETLHAQRQVGWGPAPPMPKGRWDGTGASSRRTTACTRGQVQGIIDGEAMATAGGGRHAGMASASALVIEPSTRMISTWACQSTQQRRSSTQDKPSVVAVRHT